mmetsp:Transcript_15324/g.19431  ORF Transcript_15324/g.19431 Transcript_15324/m.19431 type:complete len:356 (+) Transcript_15324:101-1168(+)
MASFPPYVKVHNGDAPQAPIAPGAAPVATPADAVAATGNNPDIVPKPTTSATESSVHSPQEKSLDTATDQKPDSVTAAAEKATQDNNQNVPTDTADPVSLPKSTDEPAEETASEEKAGASPSPKTEEKTSNTKSKERVSIPPAVKKILAKAKESKNFTEEMFPEDLPSGWILHIHDRSRTSRTKHLDRYWFTPKTGKRLRSRPELDRFLDHLKTAKGDEDVAWAMFKGKTPSKASNQSSRATQREPRKRNAKSAGAEESEAPRKRSKRLSSSSPKPNKKPQRKRTSTRKTKIVESKTISPDKGSKTSRAKNKVIAESKTISPRRKKIASKKSSSSNPYGNTKKRNRDVPQIAESK